MRIQSITKKFPLLPNYTKSFSQRAMSQTSEQTGRADVNSSQSQTSGTFEKLKNLTPYLRFGGAVVTVFGVTYKILDTLNSKFTEQQEKTANQFKEQQEKTANQFKEERAETNQQFKEVDRKFEKVYEKIEQSNDALYTKIVHLMLIGQHNKVDHDSSNGKKLN